MNATDPVNPELLDDTQAAVAEQLTTVSNLVPLISALTSTRQRGLGFVTYEGKQIQDTMIREARADIKDRIEEVRGRHLLHLIDPPKRGAGQSPAPGNIVAVSVEATVHATLHHLVRQLVDGLARRGICTLTQVPLNASPHQLVATLRALTWQSLSADLLNTVHRDLEHLIEDAHRLIDGNDRTVLNADCPHCGNRTLVVYFADDLIRCDRHPRTGRYEPCTCPDPICECKTRPRAFRHEWHRSKGTRANGWWSLADRLNLEREIS